jgi:signal transduction histidine kinase
MTLSWRLIQQRVGGRYAISLAVFLIGLPFWMTGFVLNERATYSSPEAAAQVIIISLVGHAVMGAVLLIAHLTVARNRARKPVPLIIISLVWSVAAMARILVIVYSFERAGLANDVPLEARLAVSALIAITSFGLGSYGLEALGRFRDERARILSDLIHSEEQLGAHRAAVASMKEALESRVDSRLRESQDFSTQSLDRLETALTNRTDAVLALEELRSLSEDTWRTVSQELWAKAPGTSPSIKVMEMLNLFVRSDPFRVPFIVTGSFFLFALGYSRAFDPLMGFVITVSFLGAIVPLALVFNSILRRVPVLPKTLFFLFLAVVLFSSWPLLAVAAVFGVETTEVAQVVSLHAITMAITVLTAVFPTVGRASQGILDNLSKSFDAATLEKLHIESQLDIASKKLASRLHGDIRGNFLASVLALQKSIEAHDVDEAKKTIDRLRVMLDQPLSVIGESATSDAEAFSQFVTNWSALVDISLDKPLEHVPQEFTSAVQTIIVDAVNNAVRHGSADWIRINYSIEKDDLVLTILNNGRKDSSNRVGLGTLHLNQLAGDMWSRFTNEQGITQLVVRLEKSRLRSSV